MDNDLDKFVKNEMKKAIHENKNKLSRSLIRKIPNTNISYNSVNIAVGKQGSGKGFMLIQEIIKISISSPNTHLLIYSNKTGKETDDTFESQKHLIRIPIVYVKHDDLPEFLQTLLDYKTLYDEIITKNLSDKIVDTQRDELFETLHISDFDRPVLHTLILLDDVAQAKILKNEKTFIQEMMTVCRHIHCSFFLSVQFWKTLTTNIKDNATTIFLFGGFSRRKISYFLSQVSTPLTLDEFWNEYKHLGLYQKVIINIESREIKYE